MFENMCKNMFESMFKSMFKSMIKSMFKSMIENMIESMIERMFESINFYFIYLFSHTKLSAKQVSFLASREKKKSISNWDCRISSKFADVFSFTDVFYDDIISTIINNMKKASSSM
jgi:hypothetical protein